jgi:hypothetical protein
LKIESKQNNNINIKFWKKIYFVPNS